MPRLRYGMMQAVILLWPRCVWSWQRRQTSQSKAHDVIRAASVTTRIRIKDGRPCSANCQPCLDPTCKQDVLAYPEQIKLYFHQLIMCSQVKAGGRAFHVSFRQCHLLSPSSQKFNECCSTVKMSYITSTKIILIQSPAGSWHPVVMWQIRLLCAAVRWD